MQLTATIRDINGQSFLVKEVARIKRESELDIKRLAEITTDIIKEEIKKSIRRQGSTGALAEAFKMGKTDKGWGVGDIDYLNRNVKYWRHQNYGSEAIGANWQHWLPKGRFVNERWVSDPDGYWMMPSKPIPPMNYIEHTIERINSIIRKVLSEKRNV